MDWHPIPKGGEVKVVEIMLLKLVICSRNMDHLVPRKLYLTFTFFLCIPLPGFVKSYFDSLYDEEIITEESFNAWESSSQEEPGKGVAIGASLEFFRWLRSAAEEPGEES